MFRKSDNTNPMIHKKPLKIPNTMHIGKKIEKIRELKGIKQETLAKQLGITQQAVSKIEKSENIEEERLQYIANALGVTPEAIRNFNEEAVFNTIIEKNETINQHCEVITNNHSLDKIVELYERLLKAEQEKVRQLENLLSKSMASNSK